MKRFFSRLHRPLRNERGEITFFACFFVVGVVMLISFLLLYASVRITCINIRNGAKMELNNLSATIYADTYRSQRETNFEEYLRTLYSSRDYTEMLEATVAGGLAEKIPLSTDDYTVSDISLEFNVVGDRVEYIFYQRMKGSNHQQRGRSDCDPLKIQFHRSPSPAHDTTESGRQISRRIKPPASNCWPWPGHEQSRHTGPVGRSVPHEFPAGQCARH